jgi:methylenetetrahydrofolate--tRNA-(uracil-5-)-methyltransferase
LAHYVSHADPRHYQPSNITFGIMPPPDVDRGLRPGALAKGGRGKADRKAATSERALRVLDEWAACHPKLATASEG